MVFASGMDSRDGVQLHQLRWLGHGAVGRASEGGRQRAGVEGPRWSGVGVGVEG